MDRSQLLTQAAHGLGRAINLLSSSSYAAKKTANLVESGYVNPVQADDFQAMMDGFSQEQIDIATSAVLTTQPKTASWGSAVNLPTDSSAESDSEDTRYASLDAIILGHVN